MSWDPVQRRVLGALGHALPALRTPDWPAVPRAIEHAPRAAHATMAASKIAPSKPMPPRAQAPASGTAAAMREARLWTALARAANCEAAVVRAAFPDVDVKQLRQADAKRALWPRLRALRRERSRG